MTKEYGNKATEKKVLIGKVMKYFSRLGVAEIAVEANTFAKGEKLLITGNTTGAMFLNADEIRYDLKPVEVLNKDGVSLSLYLIRCALTTSCLSWLRVNLRK